MKRGKKLPITLIAPTPPPLTGQSAYSLYLVEKLNHLGLETIPLSGRSSSENWRGHLRKFVATMSAINEIIFGARRKTVLLVLDGGWGLFFNLIIMMTLRLRGCKRIFVSHHSFAYIDYPSRLMTAITQLFPDLTHVFLCATMKNRFTERYGPRISGLVVSNARRTSSPIELTTREASEAFGLGFLSNISFEKGIREYFELVETLIAEGYNVVGHIAGPATSSEVRDFVKQRTDMSSGRIKWIGPVYGKDKSAFFSQICALAFPTDYINEAQPNVLFEALAHGVPVVTIARGCISDDMNDTTSMVASSAPSFVREAVPYVRTLIERHRCGEWDLVASAATNHFAHLRETSEAAEATLVAMILDSESPRDANIP